MTKKYIDADKLIAEIDKKWKELADKNVKVGGGKYDIEIYTYLSIKNLITSLHQEQPEVDLEKEVSNYLKIHHLHIKDGGRVVFDNDDSPNFMCDIRDIAHHFYELGRAGKEE